MVEFAFGLLLSREVQPLSDLVLLRSWELSLEVLESDILWWIFFEVIMGNRLVHCHGVPMEDIQTISVLVFNYVKLMRLCMKI